MNRFRTRSQSRSFVLDALRKHIGKSRGVTAEQLVRELKARLGVQSICTRELRKYIEELRLEGQHICAHPQTGYFIAATAEELDECCEFLHSRAMCSLTQVARMRNVSVPDLRGQLRLPT